MIRAVFAALALAACAPTEGKGADVSGARVDAPTPTDVTIRITQEQNGQTVTVAADQRFAVELIGVPTAGYVWAPTQVPEFLTRAGEATGDTVPEQREPGYTGGNHWEVFMFAATGPGTGELVIEQRRPWETNEPANQTFRITIVAQ